jgi:hypothetical protein
MPRYTPFLKRIQIHKTMEPTITEHPSSAENPPSTSPTWRRHWDWEDCLPSTDYSESTRVIEDLLGPLSTWPRRPRVLFEQNHLLHNERFGLTIFLLGNGVPPCWIWAHMHQYGCLHDTVAVAEIKHIIERYHMGTFPRNDKYTYWDIVRGEHTYIS